MAGYKVGDFVGRLSSTSINRLRSKALLRMAPSELQFVEIPIKDQPLYSADYDADYPRWPADRVAKLHRSCADRVATQFLIPQPPAAVTAARKRHSP